MSQNKYTLARYEQVALAIASDIIKGVYKEGERISGRSILAGKYNISPETARKALALLHAEYAVNVVPNIGTTVGSKEAAESFVSSFEEYNSLDAMEHQLQVLIKERNQLNKQIEDLVNGILNFKAAMLRNMQNAEEVHIGKQSWLVGKSIQEAELRTFTGATVLAVRQGRRWLASPGEDLLLQAGDSLLVVGPEHVLRQFAGQIATNKPTSYFADKVN